MSGLLIVLGVIGAAVLWAVIKTAIAYKPFETAKIRGNQLILRYRSGKSDIIKFSDLRKIKLHKSETLEEGFPYMETFWFFDLGEERRVCINDHAPYGLILALRLKHRLNDFKLMPYLRVKIGRAQRTVVCYEGASQHGTK